MQFRLSLSSWIGSFVLVLALSSIGFASCNSLKPILYFHAPLPSALHPGLPLGVFDAVRDSLCARIAPRWGMECQSSREDTLPREISFPRGSVVLSVADWTSSSLQHSVEASTSLRPDGFIIYSYAPGEASSDYKNASVLKIFGRKSSPCGVDEKTLLMPLVNGGSIYGVYQVLRDAFGLVWTHPLEEPVVSPALSTSSESICHALSSSNAGAECKTTSRMDSGPLLSFRGWHYHTQHPLEMTNLLQGFGPQMQQDMDSWSSQLWMWNRFMEWTLVARQNRVEWVLLEDKTWLDYSRSSNRAIRLKNLTDTAHAFGILVGIDAPIALDQQNSFRLITSFGSFTEEMFSIQSSISYVMEAGFDYLGSELGFSEFTHPSAQQMLDWINIAVQFLAEKYNRRMYVKVHCSNHQIAKGFVDPRTGEPLNFNFLPHYADPRLGVMVHTVQIYGLEDPAPVYMNSNFTYLFDFLLYESSFRKVVWYPETAYWINYDINVPLGLPVYGGERISDMHLIWSSFQDGRGNLNNFEGQVIFTSGFEWGYFLHDWMAGSAAWDPTTSVSSSIGSLLAPLGDSKDRVVQVLMDIIEEQRNFLIFGRNSSSEPAASPIVNRNGAGYIIGWETWAYLFNEFNFGGEQPSRVSLVTLRRESDKEVHRGREIQVDGVYYWRDIDPLLEEMSTAFSRSLSLLTAALEAGTEQTVGMHLIDPIYSALEMTSLRADLVLHVFRLAAAAQLNINDTELAEFRHSHLISACSAAFRGRSIVREREPNYAVPASILGGWEKTPTVYHFGYLWTTSTLLYWIRDIAISSQSTPTISSPCYLNFQDPYRTALGEGWVDNFLDWLAQTLEKAGLLWPITECLGEPAESPAPPLETFCPTNDVLDSLSRRRSLLRSQVYREK